MCSYVLLKKFTEGQTNAGFLRHAQDKLAWHDSHMRLRDCKQRFRCKTIWAFEKV